MGAWWRCFANGAFLELGSVGSSGCIFCVFHFISVCVCFLLSYVDCGNFHVEFFFPLIVS